MKKIFVLFCLLNCSFLFSNAQDIIILKNGDEIKAKVTEVGTNEIKYKKFDNPDGPVYSAAKSDVFMIKYQNGAKDVFASQQEKFVKPKNDFRETGFTVIPEFNFGFGITDNNDDLSLGLQLVFGYQASRVSNIGFGIGYDKYKNVEMLPLFADFRFAFTESATAPFLCMAFGYSVGLTDGSKGGLMFNPSIGFRSYMNANSAFNMSIGYRLQENSYEFFYYYYGSSIKQSLGFLNLKMGFTF